jgi:hypothetical protein
MPFEDDKPSLHKWSVTPADRAELYDALDKAFDYRGDITIRLRDGSELTGYVFNREPKAAEPYIDVFPADRDQKVRIYYKDVAGLNFSGIDTAAGKSWKAWMEKWKAKHGPSTEG